MFSEANRALFCRFVEEVFHRGNLAALEQIFTPDALIHDAGMEIRGPRALRPAVRSLLTAFPDLRIALEDQVAEGNRLAVRYRGDGTHCAEWRGIPANGQRISYTGMLIVRFESDRIAEYWAQPDMLGLLTQLGAVAPNGPTKAGVAVVPDGGPGSPRPREAFRSPRGAGRPAASIEAA